MASTYIEVDSTYRNRNLYPKPGAFEIPISQSGRKSATDALDPVVESYPLISWSSNMMERGVFGSSVITGTISAAAGTLIDATSSNIIFTINTAQGLLQQKNDYYKGLVITNTTSGLFTRIFSYTFIESTAAGDVGLIYIINAFSPTALVYGDTFSITDPTDFGNLLNPLTFIPFSEDISNAYPNNFLFNETKSNFRKILSYSTDTHIATVDTTVLGAVNWDVTDNFSIRTALPLLNTIIGAVSTTTTMTITNGVAIDNVYKDQWIRILPVLYSYVLTNPNNNCVKIIAYDGATQIATFTPTLTAAAAVGQGIEILAFTYDNFNPFSYNGSMLTQQEMSCYSVELLNVVLPNVTLNVSRGGRIAFYPYIYVQLSNVSASGAGVSNVIYSNNPNSTKMIWRVPITDVSNPLQTTYIKNDASGMVQTIKFKQNDNLYFSVHLPTGEVYDCLPSEFFSPSKPNYKIQISASFKFTSVV